MKPTLLDIPDQFETERLLARIAQPGEGAILYDAIRESLDELRPWTFVAQRAPDGTLGDTLIYASVREET
ncbi:MAG TPA: hypothetical protein VKY59_07560 [Spirillospora sp.]|nr:hypothetical protein [Spirillospora sp.]